MVIVDTTVWIHALGRDPESFKTRVLLEELLGHYLVAVTDSIRFEVLQLINISQRAELLAYLNQLPNFQVKPSTWNVAIQVAWDLSNLGIVLEQKEAITVALALQNKIPLFTLSENQKEVSRIRGIKLLK